MPEKKSWAELHLCFFFVANSMKSTVWQEVIDSFVIFCPISFVTMWRCCVKLCVFYFSLDVWTVFMYIKRNKIAYEIVYAIIFSTRQQVTLMQFVNLRFILIKRQNRSQNSQFESDGMSERNARWQGAVSEFE